MVAFRAPAQQPVLLPHPKWPLVLFELVRVDTILMLEALSSAIAPCMACCTIVCAKSNLNLVSYQEDKFIHGETRPTKTWPCVHG